jgi:hypothetical protein
MQFFQAMVRMISTGPAAASRRGQASEKDGGAGNPQIAEPGASNGHALDAPVGTGTRGRMIAVRRYPRGTQCCGGLRVLLLRYETAFGAAAVVYGAR